MNEFLSKKWSRIQRGVLFMSVALSWIAPVAAQTQEATKVAELISIELRKQYVTFEQFDAAVNKTYGVKLSPEKARVARDSLRALIFNDRVPVYMAKLIVPLLRPGLTPREVTAATLEGIMQLQVKGIARLPPERQALFVTHLVGIARFLSPSACKAMFLGEVSTAESAALERTYIAQLPLGRFEAITRLYQEASEAELEGYPDARVINAQQAQLAEKVHENTAMKRIRAQMSLDAIRRVGADSASAPAVEVCAFMTAYAEGMLDMTEPYKSWKLTRFAQSMQ